MNGDYMKKFIFESLQIAAGILVAHIIVEKWHTISNFADMVVSKF